jgi:hypothetical protein
MINVFFLAGDCLSSVLAVKRRRVMLASIPSRNSRPELIADDGHGVFLPARPFVWPGPDRTVCEDDGILTELYKR